MKAAGYIRVSTVDQATNGLSLAAQKDLLTRYAREHDMTLIGIYADEGKSAAKSLEKREALLRMIADAEMGKFDVILFKDITRWSRNSAQYFKVQERLDACKVGWIAVEQPYLETMTPTGKFQVSIMLGTSQLEADQTGQRIKFTQDAEVARGYYPFPPHNAPFGFTTKKIDGHNHLVIKPDEAAIVREMYDTVIKTGTIARVGDMLREKYGIVRDNLPRAIKNPIYKGEFRGNPHFVEPIVSPEEWEQAQKLGRHPVHKSKHDYIFSSLTYCGICGAKMRWNAPDGYKMARCLNHFNTITEKEMEKQVLAQVEPELNKYRIELKERKTEKNLRKRFETKLKRLNDLYIDGVISRDEFDSRRKEYLDAISEIETPPQRELPTNWKKMYSELTEVQKNILWKSSVDHFEVKDKRVVIAFETTKVLAERMAMELDTSKEVTE